MPLLSLLIKSLCHIITWPKFVSQFSKKLYFEIDTTENLSSILFLIQYITFLQDRETMKTGVMNAALVRIRYFFFKKQYCTHTTQTDRQTDRYITCDQVRCSKVNILIDQKIPLLPVHAASRRVGYELLILKCLNYSTGISVRVLHCQNSNTNQRSIPGL